MEAVAFAFRAESRTRWRSWLAIALLIGLVGGLALAATAAGRRTNSAYPQFVATYGYDATVYSTRSLPQLDKLPTVSSATALVSPFSGQPTCDCSQPINDSNFSIYVEPPGGKPLWKLLSGHAPDPSSPDQALASLTLQKENGVHVGTVIRVPFYTASQASAANSVTGTPPKPLGPTVAMHVVGIAVSEFDFPSGSTPSYELYTTPAFSRTVIPHSVAGVEYAVRLRHGVADLARFDTEADALDGAGVEGVSNNNGLVESVDGSIHPQAVGWWVLALLVALVGLAIIGQALARQSSVESEDYPTLVALGFERRQLVMLGMARNLVVGILGALGAVVLAVALSPLAPVGEARMAEASTGISFDALVLAVGGGVTAIAVLALGTWPVVRAANVSRSYARTEVVRPSTVVARLAIMGAPPSTLIGVRNALQRRMGGANVPVGTAFLGTVLAVTALCGSLVFGSSLTHLTATPMLYGDAYQLSFEVIPGLPDPGLLRNLELDKRINGITRGLATQVSINKATVGAVAVDALRGPLLLSTVEGHLPSGDGQIGLGAATMRQVDAHVGSVVSVTVTTPSGGRRTVPFRVVSRVPLPVLDGFVGLGDGAVFTIHGYEAAVCPPGDAQDVCRRAVEGTSLGTILTTMVSGPRGRAAVSHLLDADQSVATLPITPTSLVNFGEAVNFPLIFGGILALFGAATLIHLLLVSVSRRRRETGLLKVLGFVNGQVVSAVGWQSTTVALVGIVIGIPLGVIAGKATWTLFASQLGAVPVSVVPIWLVGALAVGVLVSANLLALGPALVATGFKPAPLLRAQ
ncbi:MAG: ABC transporter permease [Acidimicrobiales bacterium]